MNPVIIIPSRMASSRLPDKPLADINGKPMIVRVFEQAMKSDIGPVYVACDDERIKTAIEAAGGMAVMTSKDHSSGSDRIFEALQTIDKEKQYDAVINVQGDMPDIDPLIIAEMAILLRKSHCDIATAAISNNSAEDLKNPNVVKVITKPANPGEAADFTRRIKGGGELPFLEHLGIYAYKRDALKKFVNLSSSAREAQQKLEQLRALDNDMRIAVKTLDFKVISVDTSEDLDRARASIKD